MKNIYYNSSVARLCGKNGIIKAVLLNYIYNYHKPNIRKLAGHPALITLAEFVYQYSCEKKSLWRRSFIHRILKDMEKNNHITIAKENNLSVYSVAPKIVELLTNPNIKIVSFNLELACEAGIDVAIITRYLMYVIDQSPKGEAYNLNVEEMSEVNHISPAQIYRVIKHLIETGILRKLKSTLRFRPRALSLARV
jgi:hypothetical protein